MNKKKTNKKMEKFYRNTFKIKRKASADHKLAHHKVSRG